MRNDIKWETSVPVGEVDKDRIEKLMPLFDRIKGDHNDFNSVLMAEDSFMTDNGDDVEMPDAARNDQPDQTPKDHHMDKTPNKESIWSQLPPEISNHIIKQLPYTNHPDKFRSTPDWPFRRRFNDPDFQAASMLKQTDPSQPLDRRIQNARRVAVEKGYCRGLEDLGVPHESDMHTTVHILVDHGDIQCLKFLIREVETGNLDLRNTMIPNIKDAAVKYDKVDVLKWVFETYVGFEDQLAFILDSAVSKNSLKCVKYLVEVLNGDPNMLSTGFRQAYRNHNMEAMQIILDALKADKPPIWLNGVMRDAVKKSLSDIHSMIAKRFPQ